MEPTLPDALKVIGLEWREAASGLAGWAERALVNRRDQWVQFGRPSTASERPYSAVTLPARSRRGVDVVSRDKLEKHFGSLRRHLLIGLHAVAKDGTCRWLAIDLDLHKPDEPLANHVREANWQAAIAWWQRVDAVGVAPLLLDSNGVGGFHLLLLFDEPLPVVDVYALGARLTDDWESHGLLKRPEIYPKSPTTVRSGGALRLPGLHHYRDHLTRVFSGDPAPGCRWLGGRAAAQSLVQAPTLSAAHVGTLLQRLPRSDSAAMAAAVPPLRQQDNSDGSPPAILVDLDGVLARYDGWRGAESIGDLLPGAREFLTALSKRGPVVLFSSRLGAYDEAAYRHVDAWVRHHDLPIDSIRWGKPATLALVDDRAVPCRPQEFGSSAFDAAIRRVDALVGRRAKAFGTDDDLERVLEAWPNLPPRARRRIADTAARNHTGTGNA